jgi:hypothetical protein
MPENQQLLKIKPAVFEQLSRIQCIEDGLRIAPENHAGAEGEHDIKDPKGFLGM